MAVSIYQQSVFYHYILSEPSVMLNIDPEFFSAKPVQAAFKIAKEYVIKYKSTPGLQQMKELVAAANQTEVINDDMLESLYAQKDAVHNYSADWLYDNATNWATMENVKRSIVDAGAYIKLHQDAMESGDAKEVVEHIKTMFNKGCSIDFSGSKNMGSDFWDAESHQQKKLVRSSAGYPFIDFCLNGGYYGGCLIAFVGAPKIGKSLWLQNLCAESVKRGENCVYVTLELPEEMVHARIGSNMFSIPSLEYEKYSNDAVYMKNKITEFRKGCLVAPGNLRVFQYPASTLSVVELEAALLDYEEAMSTEGHPFKIKNVFIDYLNIMKNYRNPNTENTYMKIKQLAEDVRAIGTKNKWSMITATQTNKSQFDTNDVAVNQVSESSALNATVDAMFGIIADPIMKAQGKYYLKCMLDRVSPQENKKKLFTCNFNYLRIVEDTSEGILDTSLTYNQNTSIANANANRKKAAFPPGQPTDEQDFVPQQQPSVLMSSVPNNTQGPGMGMSADILLGNRYPKFNKNS